MSHDRKFLDLYSSDQDSNLTDKDLDATRQLSLEELREIYPERLDLYEKTVAVNPLTFDSDQFSIDSDLESFDSDTEKVDAMLIVNSHNEQMQEASVFLL